MVGFCDRYYPNLPRRRGCVHSEVEILFKVAVLLDHLVDAMPPQPARKSMLETAYLGHSTVMYAILSGICIWRATAWIFSGGIWRDPEEPPFYADKLVDITSRGSRGMREGKSRYRSRSCSDAVHLPSDEILHRQKGYPDPEVGR